MEKAPGTGGYRKACQGTLNSPQKRTQWVEKTPGTGGYRKAKVHFEFSAKQLILRVQTLLF